VEAPLQTKSDRKCAFQVEPTARGQRVSCAGFLAPNWLASLCAGLAERRASIVSVDARLTDTKWAATLELDAHKDFDLDDSDFAKLLERPADFATDLPIIQSFELKDSAESGGSLQIDIQALDSVGLLARLLSTFAMLSLFPVAIRAATTGERVRDTFWVTGIGGRPPTEPSRALLARKLQLATSNVRS
jgi:UTP:GlnB (protein PII) uridylyltransferase